MNTLLSAIIGAWLFRAAIEILIGVAQIFLGMAAGFLGLALWALSFALAGLQNLWETAFPTID